MRIFIINLEKDEERRRSILSQCDALEINAEIIAAVDGRLLSDDDLKKLTNTEYASGLTPSEVGCSLSHLKVYEKIVNEKIDKALIIEDDALITRDTLELIKWYEVTESPDPEVILLSEVNSYFQRGAESLLSDYSLVKVNEAALTHCYLINNSGASRLLNFLKPVWLEADRWTFVREYSVLSLKAIVPPVGLLSEVSEQSTIWYDKELLDKRKLIESKRSKTLKAIKRNRKLSLKLKLVFWRLFKRKYLRPAS